MLDAVIVRLVGGIWRLKSLCAKRNSKLLLTFYNHYLAKRGSFIGHQSFWAGEPVLPHGPMGIFVSNSARIGENCVIFQQVTIGSNTLADSKGAGAPIIGDNCYIGAGAKVIGGIVVGNNVRIGANCAVFRDIPDNSLVVSQEPVVIHKSNMDNKFHHESPKR
jgi:serine O-acetyltransferase